MRLSELGERGLLAELERRGLVHGIGHDAAELRDGVVVTQDALVEHVHFRHDWISWRELGFRAAAVNLSDLAASGAEPEAQRTRCLSVKTPCFSILRLMGEGKRPDTPPTGRKIIQALPRSKKRPFS